MSNTNGIKTKYEFLKVKNLNGEPIGTKFKLLKPKVMASNGGKVKEVKTSPFSELLKNPKVKFPLKTLKKSNDKSLTYLDIETTQITNKTDDNTLNYYQSKLETNTLEGQNNKLYKLRHMNSNTKNLNLDESDYKNNRFENLTHSENEGGVINEDLTINNQTKLENKNFRKFYKNTDTCNNSSNYQCNYGCNFRQKSSLNKTTLNVAEALNRTIQVKEISKLRHAKSLDKIKGIRIIDDIIQGLSQLKTIIANQDEDFEKSANYKHCKLDHIDKVSRKTKKNKKIDPYKESLNKSYCSSNSNRLLISSTSGNVIEIKNKNIFNLMKNKTINHKTIENERNKISSKKVKQIKSLKTLNSSFENVESIRKLSNNEKKTLDVNESLIMKIKGKGKPIEVLKRPNTSILNESNISFDNNYSKKEKAKKIKIENTFNREYSSITPNNRFLIDKFEYKILNPTNKNETTFFDLSSKKKQKGVSLLPDRRYSSSSMKSKKEKKQERKEYGTKEANEGIDDFANYIFSD